MSAVLDLFEEEEQASAEQIHVQSDPVERAIAAIEQVLLRGLSPILAFSSGKDSTCCALLTFNAAIKVKKAIGWCPKIYLVNSDTRVESPVVRDIADKEITRMRKFAHAQGLSFEPWVVAPSLARSFAARIIGGRALPSFPGVNGSCSQEWKVLNSARAIREINKLENGRTVLFIGTRSGESSRRAVSTAERKETAHTTWFGPDGDERLSPILDWDTDTVWETIGRAAAGEIQSYSDFQEIIQFYSDAGASSCVIVADMRSASTSKPCGARSGCWACVRTSADHSVENMIATEPERYPYLEPLLRLRNWIADTQWDYTLRNFVGRTISPDGYVSIKADQYSPQACKDLLRYTLWAQDQANALGASSLVQPIGVKDLLAIDFQWSARALFPPFEAIRVFHQHQAGLVKIPPVIERKVPPAPAPEIGKIFVGNGWDAPNHPMRPEGMRHAVWEMFSESCGVGIRVGADGEVFMDLDEGPEFDVDEEGAYLFLEFEAERKMREHGRGYTGMWTAGARDYLALGVVTPAKGQSSSIHSIMRRADWLQRHDLHGQRSPEELRARCSQVSAQQADLF